MKAVVSDAALIWLFGDRMVGPPGRLIRGVTVGSGQKVDDVALGALLCTWSLLRLRDAGALALTATGTETVDYHAADEPPPASGLEGALLDMLVNGWEPSRAVRFFDAIPSDPIDLVVRSRTHEGGATGEISKALVEGANLDWWLDRPRDEAKDAGIVRVEGRLRKRTVADPQAMAELEPQFADFEARWSALGEREGELRNALFNACSGALYSRAYSP